MHKTAALVLHRLKYSDHSAILKCFTRQSGTIAAFVRISKKKPGILDHQFYELSLDRKAGREMYNVQEASFLQGLNPPVLQSNTPLWLLINELLLKTTAESVPLPDLFALVTQLRSILSEPIPQTQLQEVALLSLSHQLGILHSLNIPALNATQRELLAILGVPDTVLPQGALQGSSGAMLEHLMAHFDITHLYAAELLD